MKKFINKNIYDIVIVDEAHEHNINMDIIITLTKQACYFNNKVRLIIFSATMEDDEPIYRRYIERKLREEFGFNGSPVEVVVKIKERER
mgnify:CR=1 FL=1